MSRRSRGAISRWSYPPLSPSGWLRSSRRAGRSSLVVYPSAGTGLLFVSAAAISSPLWFVVFIFWGFLSCCALSLGRASCRSGLRHLPGGVGPKKKKKKKRSRPRPSASGPASLTVPRPGGYGVGKPGSWSAKLPKSHVGAIFRPVARPSVFWRSLPARAVKGLWWRFWAWAWLMSLCVYDS